MSTVTELTAQPGVFGLIADIRVYDTQGAANNQHRVLLPLLQFGTPLYGTQDNTGPAGAQQNIYDLDQYTTALQAVKDFTAPWAALVSVGGAAGPISGWDNIAAVLGITLS